MRSTVNWEDPGLPERDGVQNSVQDLDFSRDGEILVVAVANLVLIYDAKEGDLLHRLRGHKDTVYSVAFVRDGTRFASGGADKTVIIWTRKVGGCVGRWGGARGGGGRGGADIWKLVSLPLPAAAAAAAAAAAIALATHAHTRGHARTHTAHPSPPTHRSCRATVS